MSYLTVQEVADRMRCEHRTVRRAIRAGELEAALIGGRWVIPEGSVDAWFQSRRSTVAPARQRASKPRRSRGDAAGSVARLQSIEGGRR